MISTHQALSLSGFALSSVFLYRFSSFENKQQGITYIFSLLLIGNVSSLFFGLLSNWFYHNWWQLGERFWGSLLVGTFLLPFLLKNKPNFEQNYTATLLSVSIGMLFIKLGCAISHPACYGKASTMPWAMLINGQYVHPIPIYDFLFQGVLLLALTCFFLRKPSIKIGIAWLLFTCVSDFWIDYLRSYERYIIGLSLSQFAYLTIILLNIPLAIRKCEFARKTV